MYEKLCAILDILKSKYGYSCRVIGNLRGWCIHVDYIDEGPEFGYDFPLELQELRKIPAEDICQAVVFACRRAIYFLENTEVEP